MNSKSVLYKTLAVIMVVAILSGCNLNKAAPIPTTAPTQSSNVAAPTDTMASAPDQNLINTQAAQTVAAFQTLNVPSATPVTPTVVTPTVATATPVAPTSTSTAAPTVTLTFTSLPPTAFPTSTLLPVTRTPSVTPNGYACQVISTKPTNAIKVNAGFKWAWVIENTGAAMWGQHNADLRYVSGRKMQTGADSYDLTKDVAPGATYTATIAMSAPASADTYYATWAIVQDGVTACTLYVKVNVTN